MSPTDNDTLHNWKDYVEQKFSDKLLYNMELFDKGDKHFISYKISSASVISQTEIIIRLFKDDFMEIFDVRFEHPNSPIWKKAQEDDYGWDGQGTSFNLQNLSDVDEWINISLYNGWTEATYYFDDIEIKTEVDWHNDKGRSIPIQQNYLNRHGCLTFPIVPFVIWYKTWYWKRHPDRMKIVTKTIPPMFQRDSIS